MSRRIIVESVRGQAVNAYTSTSQILKKHPQLINRYKNIDSFKSFFNQKLKKGGLELNINGQSSVFKRITLN